MTTLLVPIGGWRAKAPSNVSKLRQLLSDGRWHGQQAMQGAAGMRYGARLFDLHNEMDVGAGLTPVHYETRKDVLDDSRVQYRQVDQARCCICSMEERKRPATVLAELRDENARLRARVRELEAAR